MKSIQLRSFWMALMAVLFVAILLPATALAQQGEPGGPTRVAVLNVPGGGTDALHQKLGQIPNLEILKQAWFIKQIRNRGFEAKGIMRRPKDLKWVMDGGQLDHVLFLAPISDQSYEARIVDKDGAVTKKISVDRTADGLSESGAELIRRQFQDFLDASNTRVQKLGGSDQGSGQQQAGSGGDQEPMDPNEIKAKAATEKSAKTTALSKNWLWATGGVRFAQRSFNIVEANRETLSYKSKFYPGMHVTLEAFPFGMTNADFQAVGTYADFRYGGDSVTVGVQQPDDSVVAQNLGISHVEFAFGVAIRGENPARDMDSDPDPHSRLKIGIEYVNFGIAENKDLPTVSHFHLTIGGEVDYPMIVDGLYGVVGAELTPIGFLADKTEQLFGQTSTSFGMEGKVGLIYKFTDSVGLSASYDARVFRTVFEGVGDADFTDSNGIELVQGFSAGLQYHY